MKIQYLGHSAFRLVSEMGTTILCDPFDQKLVGYPMPRLAADVVTISHRHNDHSFVEGVSGDPSILDCEIKCCADDVDIESFLTFHDKERGAKRGKNLVFKFLIDGSSVAHLGDLGEVLETTVSKLRGVDILLVPVGGFYTINAAEAKHLIDAVNPKIVVPMHFKYDDCDKCIKDIDTVDGFLQLIQGSRTVEHFQFDTFDIDNLDDCPPRVVVLPRFVD